MRKIPTMATLLLVGLSTGALAKESPNQSERIAQGAPAAPVAATKPAKGPRGIPLKRVLDGVAAKTGQRFIVDPRLPMNIDLRGLALDEIGEDELLHVLFLSGIAAVRRDSVVSIIPGSNIRQKAIPLGNGRESELLDGEWVTYVLWPKGDKPTQLVPMLRPMLSQAGHMAVSPETGAMVIVERWEVVRRLIEVMEAMRAQ